MVTAEMNAEMNADTAEFDEKTNTDEVEFVQSQNVKNSGVDDDKAAEIRYNETLSKVCAHSLLPEVLEKSRIWAIMSFLSCDR